MIVLAILLFVLLVPCIVLMLVIPDQMQSRDHYDGAEGQQGRIYEHYGTFENYDGRVHAYWFDDEVLDTFPTKQKNVSGSTSYWVDEYDILYYPIWPNPKTRHYGAGSESERTTSIINYSCSSSDPISVYLFDYLGFKYFTKQRKVVNCIFHDEYVTHAERIYEYDNYHEKQTLQPFYLVVYNPNSYKITVHREYFFTTTEFELDVDKAVMTCSSVCSFAWGYSDSTTPTMIVVSNDYGEFTLTDGSDDSYIILTPLVSGMGEALLVLIILLIFWCCLSPGCRNRNDPPCCPTCFCESCSTPCTKKKYNIPSIIMCIITLIIGVVFVATVTTNQYNFRFECDGILSVEPDEQAICSEPYKSKILFESDDTAVTAYQYNTSTFERLPLLFDIINHDVESQLIYPKNYKILFNVSFGLVSTENPDVLSYSFSIINTVIIALIDVPDTYFDEVADKIAQYGYCGYSYNGYCEIIDTYEGISSYATANIHFNYTRHQRSFSVVAVNPSDTITLAIQGNGYHTHARHAMDESKANKVCREGCIFDNPGDTKVVLTYVTVNAKNSVPVTLNSTSGYYYVFSDLLCWIPPFFIAALVITLVLITMRIGAPDNDASYSVGGGGGVEMKQAQPTEAGIPQDYYANPNPPDSTI